MRERDEDEADARDERPSKSARKRAAHAAQELGETLIRLTPAELAALDLPERLLEALEEARRIGARGGAARQRQYIGKLMRDVDLEPLRAALGARSERQSREAQLFKRIESWRERLIREGAPALDELQRWRPELDRTAWTQLVAAARGERGQTPAAATAAGRELFRALRTLLAGHPQEPPTGTMPR